MPLIGNAAASAIVVCIACVSCFCVQHNTYVTHISSACVALPQQFVNETESTTQRRRLTICPVSRFRIKIVGHSRAGPIPFTFVRVHIPRGTHYCSCAYAIYIHLYICYTRISSWRAVITQIVVRIGERSQCEHTFYVYLIPMYYR